MATSPYAERRRAPRVMLRCGGDWTEAARSMACFTGTVSMAGSSIEIEGDHILEAGSTGKLRLKLPEPYGTFEIEAKVVWVGNSNGRPTAGLEFSSFLGEAEKRLGDVIERALREGRT